MSGVMNNYMRVALPAILAAYMTIICPNIAVAESLVNNLSNFINYEVLKRQHNLYPVVVIDESNTEKWGYIDKSGKMVIKPQYRHVQNFNNGIALIQTFDMTEEAHGKFTYIDKSGRYIIKPQNYVIIDDFHDGLAKIALQEGIRTDYKYGFINKSGKIVIGSEFASVSDFSEGLAMVSVKYNISTHRADRIWGYIDKKGKYVVEPQFDHSKAFKNGLAAVRINKCPEAGTWGFINRSGKFKIKPQFDYAYEFSEGLALVKVNGKRGYINKSGKYVIEPMPYSHATSFSDGLAMVTITDPKNQQLLYGYIDKTGKAAIKPQFDAALPFEGGYAVVGVGSSCNSYFKSGEHNYNSSCKYGVIDKKGNYTSKPQFESIDDISDGLRSVCLNNKYGFIDKRGNIVISPKFDDPIRFHNGMARFRIKDKQGYTYGYINKKEKIIWSAIDPDPDTNPYTNISGSFIYG